MTHWGDAGFGTDPEGDARRRAEQGVVELTDGTRVAGAPNEQAAVAAVAPAPHSIEAADALVRDLAVDLGVEPKPDPHAVTTTEYEWGAAVVCACGRWECAVTGPSSAAWAAADYRRHVARETASDG